MSIFSQTATFSGFYSFFYSYSNHNKHVEKIIFLTTKQGGSHMLVKKGCAYYPHLGDFFIFFEDENHSSVTVEVPIEAGQKHNIALKFFVKENEELVIKCHRCPCINFCELEKEAEALLSKTETGKKTSARESETAT